MRARSLIVVLVSALVVLSGCTSSSNRPAPKTPAFAKYVALGDSYAAGPLIAPAVKGAPVPCSRSQANYPGYLSTYLRVKKLTDVTCSSATTEDFYSSQSVRMGLPQNAGTKTPPQLDALSSTTDLVTVGIGGNDFSIFGRTLSAFPVGKTVPQQSAAQAVELEKRLTKAFSAIRERAPNARIIVVGYLRVAPESGSCTEFAVSPAKSKLVDSIERKLNSSVAAAATAEKMTYIDSYAISKGHDICAGKQAWINGAHTQLFKAAVFHPFRTGMDAVAREIYTRLTAKRPGDSPGNAMLAKVPRTPGR